MSIHLVSKFKDFSLRRKIVFILAFLIVVSSATTATILLSKKNNSKNEAEKTSLTGTIENNETADMISAGGTISAGNLSQYLGFESTDIALEIEEVYVEAGSAISQGDSILKVTDESLTKAKETLKKELSTVKSALLTEKMTYKGNSAQAYALYQSQSQLEDSALTEYESQLSSLEKELNEAQDDYNDANDIVSNAPSQISEKQESLSSLESQLSEANSNLEASQKALLTEQSEYEQEANNYNQTVQEYNKIASVYVYFSNYLGYDVSNVQLAEKMSTSTYSGNNQNSENNQKTENNENEQGENKQPSGENMQQTLADDNIQISRTLMQTSLNDNGETSSKSEMETLYEQVKSEYETQKLDLDSKYNIAFEKASVYENESVNNQGYQSVVEECNSQIKTLESEISSLESKLSKAKKNVSFLKSAYNDKKISYDEDVLTLENEYNVDVSTYTNAKYNYDLTLSSLDESLATAKDAVATAENNLAILEDNLSEGIVIANQAGTISSEDYEAGDTVTISSPIISYIDTTTYETTVELSQDEIITVALGDSVVMYSSDIGTCTGKISGISEGTAESLSNVTFKVTITADDSTALYSGASVNVYFNVESMTNMTFDDAQSTTDDSTAANQAGKMPDMQQMPDMNQMQPGEMGNNN